jgi:hypothetical protein
MRRLEILSGVAALAVLAAPALSQPPSSMPGGCNPATDASCTSAMANPSTPTNVAPETQAPTSDQAPPAQPAPEVATAPAAGVNIPGAVEVPAITIAGTPNSPSRLYVVRSTAPSGAVVNIITNGPVPDTVANRQAFGGPMSRAGRRTAPRGN